MAGKRLRRKLGKKVLAGQMTVDEARVWLGRASVQKSYGSAWSTWPEQGPAYRPREPDEEYVREAARSKVVWPQQPSPAVLTKAAKTAQKRYDQQMAPVWEMIAKGLGASTFPAPPAPCPVPACGREAADAARAGHRGRRARAHATRPRRDLQGLGPIGYPPSHYWMIRTYIDKSPSTVRLAESPGKKS